MKTEDSPRENLELPLGDNEFTMNEFVRYMKKAYRVKLNGTEFTVEDVIAWVRLKCVPESYGGYKIQSVRKSGIRVLTVTGLHREELKYLDAIRKATVNSSQKKHYKQEPRGRRTRLYYQLAGLPVPDDALPDNIKLAGIKGNQLRPARKKKK